MNAALVVPRRLAMQILHAAQVAQPQSIRGVVAASGGIPSALHLDSEMGAEGESTWAQLWSHPQAPAIPQASELMSDQLSLVVSLNTKGVLEMRAWQLCDGVAHERILKIGD
ncbi:hypothetical protein E4T66_06390 [Sinimarinibacterium sp. CAU 1509]|nr:hypothetical protein E4T66_06390 [Sinimarinibacterium sp. CAU 1509]